MSDAHVLYTGTRVNPMSKNPSEYYTPGDGDTLYVMQRDGSNGYKVFSSYGHLLDFEIGTRHAVYADQTGRFMGWHTVVGYVDEYGTRHGLIPNRAVAHSVFK